MFAKLSICRLGWDVMAMWDLKWLRGREYLWDSCLWDGMILQDLMALTCVAGLFVCLSGCYWCDAVLTILGRPFTPRRVTCVIDERWRSILRDEWEGDLYWWDGLAFTYGCSVDAVGAAVSSSLDGDGLVKSDVFDMELLRTCVCESELVKKLMSFCRLVITKWKLGTVIQM